MPENKGRDWLKIWRWLRTAPKGRDKNTGKWEYDKGDGYHWDGKRLCLIWPNSDCIYAILTRRQLSRRGVL